MEKINKIVESMDMDFLGKSKHKIEPGIFLADKDALFLDIRTVEELETITLPLRHHLITLHIPFHELPKRLSELPSNKKIGLFCSSGVRIAMAYLYLRVAGYENIVMISGGLEAIVKELKPGKIFKKINRS